MREKPTQGLMQLILAGNLNYSADIGTHYLKSVIEVKYCLYELIVATLLRKLTTTDSNLKRNPSLRDSIKSLRSEVKKLRPDISIKELLNLSNTIIEKRHALVHGEMIFGSKLQVPNPSTWVPLVDTTKITMQRGGLEISLEQESLLKINNQFDEFLKLIRELVIDLDMDCMELHIEPLNGTSTEAHEKKILLRDILKFQPIDKNISRHCITCKRDFIDDEACKHLEIMKGTLTGE